MDSKAVLDWGLQWTAKTATDDGGQLAPQEFRGPQAEEEVPPHQGVTALKASIRDAGNPSGLQFAFMVSMLIRGSMWSAKFLSLGV